VGKIWVTKF